MRQHSVACGRAIQPNTDNKHSHTQHSRTHNHTNSLPHSQHAHTPSHTCADAQMPWGVCVLTPRRQYSAPCHRNDCAARAREQAPETHLPPSAAHALGTRTRRMLTPAGIYCSGLRPPARLGPPCFVSVGRFCRHVCMRAHACAQAHARRPHPPMLCLPTLAIPRSGAQQSAALRRNPLRARPPAPPK